MNGGKYIRKTQEKNIYIQYQILLNGLLEIKLIFILIKDNILMYWIFELIRRGHRFAVQVCGAMQPIFFSIFLVCGER